MNLSNRIIYSLLIGFLLISCKESKKEIDALADFDLIIKQNPDSALQILDSIDISPKDEYNFNLFLLYLVEAKYKAEKDISKDTDIIDVYTYFKNNNSDNLAGRAAYYCGLVLKDNKEYDKAIIYYNIAESYSLDSKDEEFQSLVLYAKSELFLAQLYFDQAKDELAKANLLFQKTGNYQYEIKGYSNIALHYLIKLQYDSSLYYYDRAYEIATLNNNNVERAYAIKDKGLLYMDKGDYKESVNLINKAKNIDSTIIKSGKADLILSNDYLGLNKIDSARYYAENSIFWINRNTVKDDELLSTIHLYLSDIEESEGNYKKALDYLKLYNQFLFRYTEGMRNDAIIDTERKYKFEQAKNEISDLSFKQLKTQRIIFVLLLAIAIGVIVYYRILFKKNRQLAKANDEILTLTDSIKELDNTKKSIKEQYIHNFEILKRAASLEYFVQGNKQGKSLIKKFNEVAYGQECIDWDKLYEIINKLNDGLFDKIKTQYPQLDETEYRICCLTYSKLSSSEIAVIVQLSVNTIHMKTTYIRRKLGIEKYGTLADFFDANVK